MVETGLQREVRIAIEDDKKTASDGSFRSEEAIPSETILFFLGDSNQGKMNRKQKISANLSKLF